MQLDYYLTNFYPGDGTKVLHSSKQGRIIAWYIEAVPFIRCAEVLIAYRDENRKLLGTNSATCYSLKDVREVLKQFTSEDCLEELKENNGHVEFQGLATNH